MKRLPGFLAPLLLILLVPCLALAEETWTVCWYVCGSDLESRAGAASDDLKELVSARLPDNVRFVVQTGGSSRWENPKINPKKIERFLYHKGELRKVDSLPQANMGSEKTLASFISYCREKQPADHMVFIFWDHGGGSIGGVANDENYDFRFLSLKDIRKAFETSVKPDAAKPPFEVIGFDTCLMATLDTAVTMQGLARYLVASQDTEPGNGWNYKAFPEALGKNPGMSALELSRVMCDTYLQGCRQYETAGKATLSVTDLSKVGDLLLSYNALGLEAVSVAMDHENFFSSFGRGARAAENYHNSRSEGYSNMVDLGSLVEHVRSFLPEFTQIFLDSLHEAVVYRVNGPYRVSTGLSCYYPFDGQRDGFNTMMRNGSITSFLILNGLQHGFISRDKAVAHLERISNEISASLESDGGTAQGESPSQPSPAGSPSQSHATEPSGGSSESACQSSTGHFSASALAGLAAGQAQGNTPSPEPESHAPGSGGSFTSSGLAGLSGQSSQGSQASQPAHSGQFFSSFAQHVVSASATPAQPSGQPAQGSAFSGLSALVTGTHSSGQGAEGGQPVTPASLASFFNTGAQSVLSTVTPLQTLDISSLEDVDVDVVDGVGARMTLGPERARMVESVHFYLAYYDLDEKIVLLLGRDANINADWEKGVFDDNFQGTWAALDGHLVYLESTSESARFYHYTVPVKLNGQLCNLEVVYNLETQKYDVLGARRVLGDNMVDKVLVRLKKGDTITTIHKAMPISDEGKEDDDSDFEDVEIDTFKLKDKYDFEDVDMGDGKFMLMFEMTDVQNNSATSKVVTIDVKDGEATYEKD